MTFDSANQSDHAEAARLAALYGAPMTEAELAEFNNLLAREMARAAARRNLSPVAVGPDLNGKSRELQIDQIVALSCGGTNHTDSIQVLLRLQRRQERQVNGPYPHDQA